MTRLVFSLPMVRALRAGLKTQTRRVSPPRFKVGDVVGVGEPCRITIDDVPGDEWLAICRYEVDGARKSHDDKTEWLRCCTMDTVANNTLRSGRFMPDWAIRTQLRITKIEEQRLGDISDADAIAEGFTSRDAFLTYFGTLHKGPIDLTLPVWAIHFEVVT